MAAPTASRCAGYPRIISLELRKSISYSWNCLMENDRKEFARENGEGDEISLPSGRIVRVARFLQNWKSEKCQGNQKQLLFTCPKIVCPMGETERVRSEANHVNLPSRDSMRVFAVHERIRRKVDGGEADGRSGSERRRARDGRSEVDGGERGRAGVLLRGSVVKRIDPNHYDMSRLRFAASTMAGSSPENETPTRVLHTLGQRIKVFRFIRFSLFSRSVHPRR
ncbi:hypothetical protein ALC56_04527 [Trachymyrmex septentrionalis]|uniref:Uncharacterized protein n=1 Tax=Trachymyrmex septentrionalis TaxID=34720 RepID=A0A195FL29_9HYME|nr:hypothetical protein ALC56_04527 [Trachymyrmex septentrionalis]